MADTSNKLTMELKYTNTDFTRNFIIDEMAAEDLPQIETKMIAINDSIKAGTDGGMKDFFRSNDYDDSDPQEIIGQFAGIKSARLERVTETVIF